MANKKLTDGSVPAATTTAGLQLYGAQDGATKRVDASLLGGSGGGTDAGTAYTFKAYKAAGAKIDVPFVTPQMFGAVANGTTDDSAAFVAALAYLKANAVNSIANIGKASGKLFIPAGHYFMGTTTIDVTHTVVIEGEGGLGLGAGGGIATKLRWAANTTAMRFQASNTTGTTGSQAQAFGALNSVVRDLYIMGPYVAGMSEGEFHGVVPRTIVNFENVTIEGFQGDALHMKATSGGTPEGNATCSRFYNTVFRNSRRGVFTEGGDTSASNYDSCNFLYNRWRGFDGRSFLGDTLIGPHANQNGNMSDADGVLIPACGVTFNTNLYTVVPGQEAWASANAPSGTTADNQGWWYLMAGTTPYPAWFNGIALRAGGPYFMDNLNGRNLLLNPYAEDGQPPTYTNGPSLVLGGLLSNIKSSGWLRGQGGFIVADNFAINTHENSIAPLFERGPSGISPASDTTFKYHTTGTRIDSIFQSWASGVARTEYTVTINKNNGVNHDARVGHYFGVGGGLTYVIDSNSITLWTGAALKNLGGTLINSSGTFVGKGVDLPSGEVVKINGTQVLKERQVKPGTPTLQDVVDVLVAHGLWA